MSSTLLTRVVSKLIRVNYLILMLELMTPR